MTQPIKIGTMVIVMKSTLGMEGAIGEVFAGPVRGKAGTLWVVRFPRKGQAYQKKGGVKTVVPSDKMYFSDSWLKPVSGLPIADEEQETKLKEEVV